MVHISVQVRKISQGTQMWWHIYIYIYTSIHEYIYRYTHILCTYIFYDMIYIYISIYMYMNLSTW
jgi:hypothetical protein